MANPESAELRNRAGASKSPYVCAQADGPVAWQLLDDEAVSKAKADNKMIFLNIGYKACHYCRLMMTEAFANPQCATLLNEAFVPIIVDRQERPDIDTIYMNYVQAVNGAGGWPLNLFLTPDLAPVFGGTYWPGPGTDHGSAETEGEDGLDLLVILRKLKKVWNEQEARCRTEATEVLTQLREFAAEGTLGGGASRNLFPAIMTPPSAAVPFGAGVSLQHAASSDLDLDQLEEAYTHIAGTFDPIYGGFGIAPKFPTPPKLSFLMRLSQLPPEVQHVVGGVECAHAHEMALFTLRKIRDGALRDHVGGQGLARYAVTSDWSVPHFEKLVVDNALLLGLYLDAWLSGGPAKDGEFFDMVVELADYLSISPICLPEGGFASSEAADSYYSPGDTHLEDGAYHLWTRREFDSVVGNGQDGAIAAAHWNVLEHGNVEPDQDPHDVFINRNVLRIVKEVPDLSKQFKVPAGEIEAALQSAKAKLKTYREETRIRPAIDDMVITSWNGVIMAVLARVGVALKDVEGSNSTNYINAASQAAAFIKEKVWDGQEKVLYRTYREGGRGNTTGFAEDYAFLIEGLLDLYHATWDESWLQWADELQQIQINLFYDPVSESTMQNPSRSSSGGFYSTPESSPHTILRLKDGMDTSLPATNAVSVSNLFRLAAQLSDARYAALARETVSAFEAEMMQYPWLFPGLLTGVVAMRLSGQSWVISPDGRPGENGGHSPSGEQLLRAFYVSPRGGVRALVKVEKDSWVASRNEKAGQLLKDGKGGVFCQDGTEYRPLTTKDLATFTGQA